MAQSRNDDLHHGHTDVRPGLIEHQHVHATLLDQSLADENVVEEIFTRQPTERRDVPGRERPRTQIRVPCQRGRPQPGLSLDAQRLARPPSGGCKCQYLTHLGERAPDGESRVQMGSEPQQ